MFEPTAADTPNQRWTIHRFSPTSRRSCRYRRTGLTPKSSTCGTSIMARGRSLRTRDQPLSLRSSSSDGHS